MRMTDFVVREAIVPELTATTKEGVIREMVGSLAGASYLKAGEKIGRASCRERVESWVEEEAEDGIRDDLVTGVQTCALPISRLLQARYGTVKSPRPRGGPECA